MTVHPEVAALIARLEAESRPASIGLPIADGRRNFEAFLAGLSHRDELVDACDAVLDTLVGPVPVRRYRPPGGSVHGTIVYLHGGGWVFGGLGSHDGLCRAIAREACATVVAVAYRLAPEHPYPAALDDVSAAVAAVAAQTSEAIAVAGDSAGANLALAACLRARDAGAPPLALQLLLYPPTVPGGLGTGEPQGASTVFLTRAEMDAYWDHYLRDDGARRDPHAVIAHADLRGLPPAYVVAAGDDPLHPEALALVAALERAGVDVTLRDYRDMVHGFMLFTRDLSTAREAIVDAGRALRAAFDGVVRAG